MGLEASTDFLTSDERRLLLGIARASLEEGVRRNRRLDLTSYVFVGALQKRHGAFVTLWKEGELRGCVGHVADVQPLAHTVRDSAFSAALRDNRFLPVTWEELPSIRIEISALTSGDTPDTPFRRVSSIDEIVVGRDGVFVERPPSRGGLLLPQVATERGWDAKQLVSATCLKAGYPADAWRLPDTLIYRFTADVFSEEA